MVQHENSRCQFNRPAAAGKPGVYNWRDFRGIRRLFIKVKQKTPAAYRPAGASFVPDLLLCGGPALLLKPFVSQRKQECLEILLFIFC